MCLSQQNSIKPIFFKFYIIWKPNTILLNRTSSSFPAIIKKKVHLTTFDSPSDSNMAFVGIMKVTRRQKKKPQCFRIRTKFSFSEVSLLDLNSDLSGPSCLTIFLQHLTLYNKHSFRTCCRVSTVLKAAEKRKKKDMFVPFKSF